MSPPDMSQNGEGAPKKSPTEIRAVPEPSRASKDRPAPKPVRPRTPPPVQQAHPSATGETPEEHAKFDAKTISDQASRTTVRGESKREDPKGTKPTISSITRATPRPGMTQALKIGPGDSAAKAQFTMHTLRGQERLNVKQEVDVSYRLFVPLKPDTPTIIQRGRLVDISLGGAQIEGPLPPEAAGRTSFMVRAEFALPFVEKPLVVDAQVVWTKPSTIPERAFMGLRFDALSQEQTNLIRGFLIGAQSPTRSKFHRGR